jgi:hypothetical protein
MSLRKIKQAQHREVRPRAIDCANSWSRGQRIENGWIKVLPLNPLEAFMLRDRRNLNRATHCFELLVDVEPYIAGGRLHHEASEIDRNLEWASLGATLAEPCGR